MSGTEFTIPQLLEQERKREQTALDVRRTELEQKRHGLERYIGKKDSYQAVRWLDGVSGTYEAIASRGGRKFVKAYDLVTAKQRDFLYARALEALNDLAPEGITLPAEDTGSEKPLIVQEFVEGRDLSNIIADGAPFETEEIRLILEPIVRKLGLAHAKGWVNRDVKPANIRYRTTDKNYSQPLINDWDLGYHTERHLDHNHGAGTTCWKAPEQFELNPKADERADIYALGVILYEMMTGFDPYFDMNLEETKTAKLNTHNPRELNPALDEQLTLITIRATQPDRRRRYQNLTEMTADFKKNALRG